MFKKNINLGGIIIYNLKAELRDKSIKAKKLRRNGMIPATIYGRNLKEPIMLQIPLADINRFLSKASKGNTLTIEVEDKKYNVLFKEITRESVSQQVEQIEFQHLVADEAVNSVIKVVLANRDKNQNLTQQHIEEIPYNALPKHFIPEVVIDLDGMNAGTTIKIEDLDIAKNENIRITIPEDTVVLTVAELKKVIVESETESEPDSEE